MAASMQGNDKKHPSNHQESSSDDKKLKEGIEAIYKCPVCLVIPICSIYQCLAGHLICVDCYYKMSTPVKCPTCRSPFSVPPDRNRRVELITAHFELPCTFSDKGCTKVGIRCIMQEHIQQCVFQNHECPYWTCKEKMRQRNIVDHLKNVHVVNVIIEEGGEDSLMIPIQISVPIAPVEWSGAIVMFDGNSFLLNCHAKEHTMIFWVTIVGTEEDAQKYEAVMSVESAEATTTIKIQGKVYSTEMSKNDVLNGASAKFEIGRQMAKGIGITRDDGVRCIEVVFNIFRK